MRWVVLCLACLLGGCDALPFGFTDVSEIRQRPGFYEGREIKIRGEVTNMVRIPFLETRLYTLQDATGEIVVVAADRLPDVGEKLALKGMVQSAAIIGGEALGVRIKELRRLPGYLAPR